MKKICLVVIGIGTLCFVMTKKATVFMPVASGTIESRNNNLGTTTRTVKNELDDVAIVQTSREKAESIEHFFAAYRSATEEELQRDLAESKKKITELSLLEKANRGSLNLQESTILVTEMRRQAVIAQQITKAKIAAVEERFL